MTPTSDKNLQHGILDILARAQQRHLNRHSLCGRPYQRGVLENYFEKAFNDEDRDRAYKALDVLTKNGYVRPTYRDLASPEDWITITDRGKKLLEHNISDEVDLRLSEYGIPLVELRAGMWDAASRSSPGAIRHTAHSARELIVQLLRAAAPDCSTMKQKIKQVLVTHSKHGSNRDVAVVDATIKFIEANHQRSIAVAHSTQQPNDATAIAQATDLALRLLFGLN